MYDFPTNFRIDTEYKCSASAQPTPEQILFLSKYFYPMPILIVNLRAEPDNIFEKEVCEQFGIDYLHIPVVDHCFPDFELLPKFVIPNKFWIHFHCKAKVELRRQWF